MARINALIVFGLILAQVANGNQSNLDVTISFRYPKSNKLKIDLYSVKPEFMYSIARTGVSENLNKTPADQKISNKFEFNSTKTEVSFVLVVKNDGPQPKYFFATPHTYKPEATALSAVFECLCNHHVYSIPPKSIWFRVVRLDVNFDLVPKGARKLDLVHVVIEVSETDAKSKYRQLLYEQL